MKILAINGGSSSAGRGSAIHTDDSVLPSVQSRDQRESVSKNQQVLKSPCFGGTGFSL
jgi:hypothetical protein